MMERLRTIYDTVNQIQQEKDSDQNNVILRKVKSVNKRIDKTLKQHEELNGSIRTVLINIDDYKITQKAAEEIRSEILKLIDQMKEIAGLD